VRLLSGVLIVLATAVFLLFLYALSNPTDEPLGWVAIGMPVLAGILFVFGVAVRFVRLPED
jgi:4-amino-4-deoxy-L-arabinose transferase-like glycosyltransferase